MDQHPLYGVKYVERVAPPAYVDPGEVRIGAYILDENGEHILDENDEKLIA